jgi:hypothetical protein
MVAPLAVTSSGLSGQMTACRLTAVAGSWGCSVSGVVWVVIHGSNGSDVRIACSSDRLWARHSASARDVPGSAGSAQSRASLPCRASRRQPRDRGTRGPYPARCLDRAGCPVRRFDLPRARRESAERHDQCAVPVRALDRPPQRPRYLPGAHARHYHPPGLHQQNRRRPRHLSGAVAQSWPTRNNPSPVTAGGFVKRRSLGLRRARQQHDTAQSPEAAPRSPSRRR